MEYYLKIKKKVFLITILIRFHLKLSKSGNSQRPILMKQTKKKPVPNILEKAQKHCFSYRKSRFPLPSSLFRLSFFTIFECATPGCWICRHPGLSMFGTRMSAPTTPGCRNTKNSTSAN